MTPGRMRSEPDGVVASPFLRTREIHVEVDGRSVPDTNDEERSAADPARRRCSHSRSRMDWPKRALRGLCGRADQGLDTTFDALQGGM
jgi:hypothetical protein